MEMTSALWRSECSRFAPRLRDLCDKSSATCRRSAFSCPTCWRVASCFADFPRTPSEIVGRGRTDGRETDEVDGGGGGGVRRASKIRGCGAAAAASLSRSLSADALGVTHGRRLDSRTRRSRSAPFSEIRLKLDIA